VKKMNIEHVLSELRLIRSHLEGSAKDKEKENASDLEGNGEHRTIAADVKSIEHLISALETAGAKEILGLSAKLANLRAATLDATAPLIVPALIQQVSEGVRSRVFWSIAPIAAVFAFFGFKLWSVFDSIDAKVKEVEKARVVVTESSREAEKIQMRLVEMEPALRKRVEALQKTADSATTSLVEVQNKARDTDQVLQRTTTTLDEAERKLAELKEKTSKYDQEVASNTETVPPPQMPDTPPGTHDGWLLAAFTDGHGKIVGWNVTVGGQRPDRIDELQGATVKALVDMRLREDL